MAKLLFHNALLVDPEADAEGPGSVLVEDGVIRACLGAGEPLPTDAEWVDVEGRALAPGFLDVHYHGELIFRAPGDLAASLQRASASMLRHGTTGFLPTTVAWGRDALRERVGALARAVEDAPPAGASVLGFHLEGPWISPAAAGAQPPGAIRPYDPAEGRDLLDRAEGRVRMVTLAPEIPGASELAGELARRGVVAALGHSRAEPPVIERGIGEGVRHVTHLFNAMSGPHHRDRGVAGVALTDDRLSCDLICDGVHVDPSFVRLAARAKCEQLMLITDRIELTGEEAAEGFGAGRVHEADGALRLEDGTLAGSSLTLDRAVQNAVLFRAMTRHQAVAAATLRPAKLLGVEASRGTLRSGARADFAVLDLRTHALAETWLAGRRVHAA